LSYNVQADLKFSEKPPIVSESAVKRGNILASMQIAKHRQQKNKTMDRKTDCAFNAYRPALVTALLAKAAANT
jgi:hypothetical protein